MTHPLSKFSHFFSFHQLWSIHWCFNICLSPSSLSRNPPGLQDPTIYPYTYEPLPGRNLGHQFQDSKYNRRIGDDRLWYTTSSGHLIQVEIQLHDEHHNQQRDSMQLQKQEPNEHWMQDEFFQYSIKSFQNHVTRSIVYATEFSQLISLVLI